MLARGALHPCLHSTLSRHMYMQRDYMCAVARWRALLWLVFLLELTKGMCAIDVVLSVG